MCGRFTLQISPEMLVDIFGLSEIPVYPARYNIAPSQNVAVIRQTGEGQNHVGFLRWGLIPFWAKDKSIGNKMINARSETVQEKPSFRHSIRYRRCLIPSSGFFEWRREGKTKKPSLIRLKDNAPMVFAGLWDTWKSAEGEIESCTILTTDANNLVAPLHERMPVILHPSEFGLWLDRDMNDPEKLKRLYQPYPGESMEMYPVSPLLNSAKLDTPDLVQPYNEQAHL